MSELHKKFGDLLKLERERKNLRLEDLASQLKITQTNLEYLESGEIAALPSEVYYNLFAKSYAEALGIDFSRTMEAIRDDLGVSALTEPLDSKGEQPADEKAKTAQKTPPETEPKSAGALAPFKKFIRLFVAILVVFVLFIIAAKFFFGGDQQHETAQPVTEETAVTHNEVSTETGNDAVVDYDWKVPEYQKPEKIRLTLIPRDESWSTIVADGDTALFRNLVPGRAWELEADYRFIVSVGIPSLVDIKLNGQSVDLKDSLTGRISRVEINQMNLGRYLHPDSSEATISGSPTGTPAQPPDTGGTVSADDAN